MPSSVTCRRRMAWRHRNRTAGRYALERRPNVTEAPLPDDLQVMCARCHSAARVSLQRRDADEWLKLVHMHVGQWPTLEYHASSRDRLWWDTATKEVPQKLEKLYPLETADWQAWKAKAPVALEGKWIVHGHAAGRGDYHGDATITSSAPDEYAAKYSLAYARRPEARRRFEIHRLHGLRMAGKRRSRHRGGARGLRRFRGRLADQGPLVPAGSLRSGWRLDGNARRRGGNVAVGFTQRPAGRQDAAGHARRAWPRRHGEFRRRNSHQGDFPHRLCS